MHTHKIIDLMDPLEHCSSCGALMVSVKGGALCAHCGFSALDEPAEGGDAGAIYLDNLYVNCYPDKDSRVVQFAIEHYTVAYNGQ